MPAQLNVGLLGAALVAQCLSWLALSAQGGIGFAGALAGVLLTPLLWSLIHEAIHGHLYRQPACSRRGGRLLAVGFGAPFAVLQAGHLFHHRFNRSALERTEVYDPRVTPAWQAAVAYYFRLLGGLYLAEWLSNFLVWLPRAWLRKGLAWASDGRPRQWDTHPLAAMVTAPRALHEARRDALAVLMVWGGVSLIAEPGWLAALLLGRGLWVSLFDNLYHYGAPLNDRLAAHDVRTLPWLQAGMLNFNLHHTHHCHPQLRWSELPGAADQQQVPGPTLRDALLQQLAGPRPYGSGEQSPERPARTE